MNELPPGLRIEHTLVQANVNGAAVVLGQERVLIDEPKDGRIPLEARIDWVMVLQVPPATLKRLSLQINEIVGNYEAMFGPIPMDIPKPTKPALSLVERITPSVPLGRTTETLAEVPALSEEEMARIYRLHDAYGQAGLQGHHRADLEDPLGAPLPSPSEPTP